MFFNKFNERTRALGYSLFVMGLVTGGLVWAGSMAPTTAEAAAATAAAPAATFPANAGTLGAIPDGSGATTCGADGAARDVTFTVSGMTAPLANVEVSVTFGAPVHTWRGDLGATLIAPNATSFTLFKYIGSTTAGGCGGSQDFAGPYNFKDSAAGTNIWSVTATPTTAGDYRTTAAGGAGQTNPAPVTNLTTAFAGLSTAQINGTWTLRVTDGGVGDTGAVSAATLTLTSGTPLDAASDFNGDGKTDFSIVRPTGADIDWWITDGIAVPPAGVTYRRFGSVATDFVLSEDFDGDGKDDITVWRQAPAGTAGFYILQSVTSTVRFDNFGQTGDDPKVLGDYDGDGKADPATYRCPAFSTPAGQCYFFYRQSAPGPFQNQIIYVPWGFGNDGSFFPYVGDFDGDGKNDFCIQRANPTATNQGQFVLRRSSDNGVEYIDWGLSSDFLIPGDYDGDGKTDLCLRRTVSGARQHYILTRTGSIRYVQWGVTGDISAPGDYDGDGKTDIAVWRGQANADANFFYVLQSSDNALRAFEWGQCPSAGSCDLPVASWPVH